jgi:hypothetical protein
MGSIVLEIQQDALNSGLQVSDILQKGLLVAKKLALSDIEKWITSELYGFGDMEEVPPYRNLRGEVMMLDANSRWQAIAFQDQRLKDFLSQRNLSMSVLEIEKLLLSRTPSAVIGIPFPQVVQEKLMQATGSATPPTLVLPYSSLSEILAGVRGALINLMLELEHVGILGEGLKFTDQDRSKARDLMLEPDDLFGEGDDSAEEDGALPPAAQSLSPAEKFLDDLKVEKDKLSIDSANSAALSHEIDLLQTELRASDPRKEVIDGSLGALRRILIGAGGPAAMQLLLRLSNCEDDFRKG